jgi:hypothetical protein
LWEEAFKGLSPKDAAAIAHSEDLQQTPEGKRAILTQLLEKVEGKRAEWEDKRWRCYRKGEVVIVIDVWNKVTRWTTGMIAIVDTVVQYDPVHAALPWAGVKLILHVVSIPLALFVCTNKLIDCCKRLSDSGSCG